MTRAAATYVEESRFGFWFLQSRVWQQQVLRVAIDGLKRLIDAPLPGAAVLLDAGCGQYLDMLREQGFACAECNLSSPCPWWSRAKDFGLLERWGLCPPKPLGQRDETLVNLAPRKSLQRAQP